jgi:hypothetical protein
MHRDPEGVTSSKGCDPFRVETDGSSLTGALPPPIEWVAFSDWDYFSNSF